MKSHKLTLSLFILVFLGSLGQQLKASSYKLISDPKSKPIVNLKYVFINEVNFKNKDILKLYDDLTYEFLFFDFFNKKPRVRSEKGIYSLKHQKLILRNKSKTQQREHKTHFLVKDDKGLFEFTRFGFLNKEVNPVYAISKDIKYWQATYKDTVFGEITNDIKARKKIVEVKPLYVPVAPIAKELIVETNENHLSESSLIDKKFLSRDSLKKIKVVIVVGPVEDLTKEFIAEQKGNAKYLTGLGVQVIELYDPNAKWKDIVSACEGANILIYSGHGSNQGINYAVGGMCVSDGIYHAQQLLDDLKLHKNALVLFNHVCGSAGSSAGDNGDIGKNEALKRVNEYSYPFLKSNAAAYYANNYDECIISFFESFFKRKNMKDIYTQEASKWTKIETRKKCQFDNRFEIGVASSERSNQTITRTRTVNGKKIIEKIPDSKAYDVAYVGIPSFTVIDFFK